MSPLPWSSRGLPNDGLPEGYERIRLPGATVVSHRNQLEAIRAALEAGTLYEYAARHRESRPLAGRGVAYATRLPNGDRVVVRHNRHGGLFARVTGDRFLTPTRAPYELATSIRLTKSCEVPTPPILAYAIYDAGPFLRRSDVVSMEMPNATDLAAVLMQGTDAERREGIHKTAILVGALSRCGARHHDLNIKNVLLVRDGPQPFSMSPYVLDVDRVTFGPPGAEVTEANIARLQRSARKWRALHGARVDERELEWLALTARRSVSTRS